MSGGTAIHAVVESNSLIHLESGGIASRNCIFGGKMTVFSGCKAIDTEIDRGGSAIISSGGSMKKTHISAFKGNGGVLSVCYGAKATETTVDYNGKMYVSNGGTADKTYLNGSMYVDLGGIASRTTVSGGSMIVSNGGSATRTGVSGGSMIVSQHGLVTNTTVYDGGKIVIASDGTATKTTVSGTLTILNGGTANTVTGKKAFIDVSAGASASNVVVNGGSMSISQGATVTNITNRGADIRVAKGAVVSSCKGNPLYFEDADLGSNGSAKASAPPGLASLVQPEKIANDTTKMQLDKAGTVSLNGKTNFVGNEDEYDYARISLSNAARLSFRIEATGAAKFTIWKWDGSKMVSLQSTTLKKDRQTGQYTVKTGKCLMEKNGEGEYYISVQALNVKTGGFAYYNVFLNKDDCIFFNHCDNSENYWMVDSNKKLNKSSDVPTLSVGLTPMQLQVDKTSVNYKTWDNFVGHNDDTDYAKLKVTQNVKASFVVTATDAAKFTVYQIINRDGVYSLKSVQSKALIKQRDGTYKAILSSISLKKENDYCICMKSTNAKKGGNAYYNVSYSAVSAPTAALTGPEEEAVPLGFAETCAGSASGLSMPEVDSLAISDALGFGQYDADVLADASAADALRQVGSLLALDTALLA